MSKHNKDINLPEYYTISAHGIVHVYNYLMIQKQRDVKKLEDEEIDEDASSEVVTLSEWMYESTMFNIVSKLHFFKHYAEKKVFSTWRLNVRYRLFCKTR